MKMLNELQVKAADMLQAFDANRERVKEAGKPSKSGPDELLKLSCATQTQGPASSLCARIRTHKLCHNRYVIALATKLMQPVNDSGSESGEQEPQHERAHGHDNHESATASEDGSEVDEHDRPQTPLGGTDPTAPNAPSYADMAHQ